MRKNVSLALALLFYASILPWPAGAAPKARFSDLVLEGGPWMDVRAPIFAGGAKCDNTTNDSAAFNAAIDVLRTSGRGGKILMPAGRCVFTAPINATNLRSGGITFEGVGSGGGTGVGAGTVLVFKHTGVGFDLTGSRELAFRDFAISGSNTTTPKVGFLLARQFDGAVAGSHKFFNVNVQGEQKFSVAPIYSYGSEENDYYGCFLNNEYIGGKILYSTGYNNILPMASTFVTIATGSQSNSVTNVYGGSWINSGGTGSDIIYMDGADDFHVFGGFWHNGSIGGGTRGRAYVYVDAVNAPSNWVSISGIRGEPSSVASEYGVYFADGGSLSQPIHWYVVNSKIAANTNVLYISDNTAPQFVVWKGNHDIYAKGASVKSLFYGDLEVAPFTSRAGGELRGSRFRGTAADYTFGGDYGGIALDDITYNSKWVTPYTPDGLAFNGPAHTLTLNDNTTTTTVGNHSVTSNSIILLSPTSANAAASGAFVSGKVAGTSFTVTHDNTSATDKTFNFWLVN